LGPQPLRRAVRELIGEPSYHSKQNRLDSADFWLRPVRALPEHWYVVGISLDLSSRLSWAIYISPGQTVVQAHVTLLLGAIELARRAMWGLFRLEWEQIRRKSVEVHSETRAEPLLGADVEYNLYSGGPDSLEHRQANETQARIGKAIKQNRRRLGSGIIDRSMLAKVLPDHLLDDVAEEDTPARPSPRGWQGGRVVDRG